MKFLIFLSFAITSLSAFAYQDGTYECPVDAYSQSVVVIKTINLTPEIQLPYITTTFKGYQRQKLAGIGSIDTRPDQMRDKITNKYVTVVEESLYLGQTKVISFNAAGEVSADCKLVE